MEIAQNRLFPSLHCKFFEQSSTPPQTVTDLATMPDQENATWRLDTHERFCVVRLRRYITFKIHTAFRPLRKGTVCEAALLT